MSNNTGMMWHVFDKHDCFTSCNTVADAAIEAAHLVDNLGMKGVHIVHMTRAQFDAYCKHGKLEEALNQ